MTERELDLDRFNPADGAFHAQASDASAYISGQSICIDGGLTAGFSVPLMEQILGGE